MLAEEVTEAKLKIIDRFQKGLRATPEKRTSQINIVWNILETAPQVAP